MRRGQADVDDRDVGGVAAHLEQEIVGVRGLPDDVETGFTEEPGETLAQKDAVLGDRYAHGISAFTRVPPPWGVQTRRRPPRASTRSASPRRPDPCSLSAPPMPSSTTSTTNSSPSRVTSIVARLACACLPMLARLSVMT